MTQTFDLFSFGTLMDTELLQLVSNQDINSLVLEPADVPDQSRRWVVDDHYPVLIPQPGSNTRGLIIRGLEPEALNRIVFFEGMEFSLEPIEVLKANGQLEQIQHFAHNHRKPISDAEWSLSNWVQTTKADTMLRVVRYMGCYGKMSPEEADAYW